MSDNLGWKFLGVAVFERAALDIAAGNPRAKTMVAWKRKISARAFVREEEWNLFSTICDAMNQDPDAARSQLLSPNYDAAGIKLRRNDHLQWSAD